MKKNGNLAAFMRDSGDNPPRVHYSESTDLGETWSGSVKTDIPNTASVEVLVLKDGRWSFVGNNIPDGRNQLALFLSDDEGKTWKWKTYLEYEEPKAGSFSYPSLIQTEDGFLHSTYSFHLKNDKKANTSNAKPPKPSQTSGAKALKVAKPAVSAGQRASKSTQTK
jgi:predicted neuraminidase